MALDITTEIKGLEQVVSAIALLSSPEWITSTLKANKQAFSDLEREHYNTVTSTTITTKRTGVFGVDTGALYRDLTENIIIDNASFSVGSGLSYATIVEELLGRKRSQGQAQESSLLPSEEEFFALLEPLILSEAESIWNAN